MDEELIIVPEAQEETPIIEEEKVEEPQPLEYKEPDVQDTYSKEDNERAKADFIKELEERYPIKGKASIDNIDRKDPNAFKQYLNDIQDNTRNDLVNEAARKKALEEYNSVQNDKHWETVYKAYPNIRSNEDVFDFIKAYQKGKDVSPLAAANSFNKLMTKIYNEGFNAAKSVTRQVPSKQVGNQAKAAPIKINQKAMNDRLSFGTDDDIAEAIAAAQKAGIGGL